MKRRNWRILAFLFGFALLTNIVGITPYTAQAAPLLQQGSANGDVWDLQFRLKLAGFYQLPLDGLYGSNTAQAVKGFQSNFGLNPDGVVGDMTWSELKKHSLNREELDILAKVIYSEARGESYEGQVAVGAVVMNRIQSGKFGDSIKDVVFQKGAFTAVADGQYNLMPDSTAYLAAQDAVRGWDPSNGSLYYFNPKTATSAWIWTRPQTIQIGNHIFAK
ncbi:cell wall hydrolase [Paenibacillus sp. OAS669]|uniref:cell wall hydrolase n=1 Tax=Paenibacillus sp. OAS669 TaxID=2663821 RepID=UPI00178BA16B|nr:cell wall hydrolase [Paenibacillus sp. OAS669]MBE1443707.1 N-acetylmuramoyl-L-alanine amidase [Paenibacillus sp. OAS669]